MAYFNEDEEKQARVARTQVRAMPMQNKQRVANPGAGPTGSQLQKLALAAGKKAALGPLGPLGAILGGLFNKGGKVPQYNMGGQMPLNPQGYNEGGSTMETPIKKEMDLQKMRQQEKAFELEQKRKDEAHQQQMRLKDQQAKQAMQMKKESATMKTPLSKQEEVWLKI